MTSTNEKRPYALVVDDDPFIQLDAASILEDAGFRTMEANNGDRGWQVLTQHHASIAVLFTDVQMPGSIDGFSLARKVAAFWPEIAIVVASGQLKPKTGELPEGATFIGKPFSAELIRDHLKQMLPDDRKPEPLKG